MRAWLWSAALVVVLLVAGTAAFVAYMLPSNDTPRDPDVVVVLGGAGGRVELGIELAARYDALLVLSSSAAELGADLGLTCGVDAVCVDPEPETTAGEAATIARMAREQGWGHITVATADFHTSRSRYVFRQCLGQENVTVVGAETDRSRSRRAFVEESLATIASATIRRPC